MTGTSAAVWAPPGTQSAAKIESIQALRGMAACLVAAMHCTSAEVNLAQPVDTIAKLVTQAIGAVGGAGVDIFFVISGFIILRVADRPASREHRAAAAARFLFHRAARIYPLYWVTLLVAACLAWSVNPVNRPYRKVFSFSVWLLTTTHIPFQTPAWSLGFEMWFYTGTAALLLLLPRRFFHAGVILWALAQLSLLVWARQIQGLTGVALNQAVLTRPQVLEFFLGCAVARLVETWRPAPRLTYGMLACAGAPFLYGCILCYGRLPLGTLADSERVLFWGLPASFMVWAAISLEHQGALRVPGWLCRLGDQSYSIYLWHFPVMAAAFSLAVNWHHRLPGLWQAAATFVVTLCIAPWSYRVIERSSIQFARAVTRPIGAPSTTRSANQENARDI